VGVAIATDFRAGVVGVDHVAEPDEDAGTARAHRLHDREVLGRVAADVLPGEVASEGETERRGSVLRRRRAEGSLHRRPMGRGLRHD